MSRLDQALAERFGNTAARSARVRVWPVADLAGVAELAAGLGVSPSLVCNWAKRHPDFPQPLTQVAAGRLWSMTAVREWREARAP